MIRRLLYIVAIPFLFILFYKLYTYIEYDKQYKSLDNVFKEMNYAAIHFKGLVEFPNLSTALESNQAYRKPDMIKGLPIKNTLLQEDESMVVYVGLKNIMMLEYKKELYLDQYIYKLVL